MSAPRSALLTVTQNLPMFSTELSTVWALFAVAISGAAALFAALSWRISRKSRDDAATLAGWVHENNKASVSLARLTELETELTELTDSYSALMKSHRKLRSRIGMRENRERGRDNGSDDTIESTRDKGKLRLAAKKAGFL